MGLILRVFQQEPGIPIEQTDSDPIAVNDIEDLASHKRPRSSPSIPVSTKRRKLDGKQKVELEFTDEDLSKYWRDVLGDPPDMGSTKVWLHRNCQY